MVQFAFMSVKYVVCLCRGWICVLCLNCEVCRCRCSCMGSIRIFSYICCMLVSCVHPDLQFVNAGRGCKRRPYGRSILQIRSQDCLICNHERLLLFPP